jgi:hypothetical protein
VLGQAYVLEQVRVEPQQRIPFVPNLHIVAEAPGDELYGMDPQRPLAAKFAVMHNAAQIAMMRSFEAGQGNETALQSRPRTS